MSSNIKRILNDAYGKFETELEVEYENRLTETMIQGDWSVKSQWATYNQVILELKHNLKDMIKVKELQYKLTDGENPNRACMSVLEDIRTNSPELERLYLKIKTLSFKG